MAAEVIAVAVGVEATVEAAVKAAVEEAVAVAVVVIVMVVTAVGGGSSDHFNYMTLTIPNIIIGNGCAVNVLM